MTKPAISIVTPSFNHGQFIERTILSVLEQDARELEYIIYDGGSTDNTIAVLRRYENDLYWASEADGGQADAVNKGFAKARGELLGWLNSDDVYCRGALQTVLNYSADHPEVDVIYGDANHIDVHGAVIEPYPTQDWDFETLQTGCFLCQPAVFIRRRVIDRFGMLDTQMQYCMDYEFWLRLGLKGAKFGHVPRVLAGSRLHPHNKTIGSRVKVHAEINYMLRGLLGKVPDKWIYNYAHAVLDARGWRRADRRSFALAVSLLSLGASIRWNRTISRPMLRATSGWVVDALRN